MLDVQAEWYKTFLFLTMFRMIAAQSNELFTYGAAAIRFSLTVLGVRNHTLHLLTAGLPTVGIPTLARVHQRLYAPLDRHPTRFLRILGIVAFPSAIIEVETELVHFVFMAVLLKARTAKVKVLQRRGRKTRQQPIRNG